ncbi:unnamed protein product, partial [Didymodactylos carnosus]
MKSGETLME